MVYSFDIFDTLITRDLARPEDLFRLLHLHALDQRLAPAHLLEGFCSLRVQSEKIAQSAEHGKEVTLDAIYKAMGDRLPALDKAILDNFKALEWQLELAHCHPVAANIARIEQLLERSERVVLISDMYLPRQTIEAMLAAASKLLPGLPLYLSSELGLTKRQGELYAYVCQKEGIPPSELRHHGDSRFADYWMARREGVKAYFCPYTELNQIEKNCAKADNDLTASIVAGTSRVLRTKTLESSPCYELGATFTAPFFYGFVCFLLREAEIRGIKQLCFLARDGYLLQEMAEILIERQDLRLDCRYLCVSRQSVKLAAVTELCEEHIDWAFSPGSTIGEVAERLSLPMERLTNLYGHTTSDKPLEAQALSALKQSILQDPVLGDAVLNAAEEARSRFIGYLRQKTAKSDLSSLALVDLGWQGSIQDSVYQILSKEFGDVSLTGFYYGSLPFYRQTHHHNKKIAYQHFPFGLPFSAPILESLLAADHGTALRYEKDGENGWKAVLKHDEIEDVEGWSFEDYRAGIRDFTLHVSDVFARYPAFTPDFRSVDAALLDGLRLGNQLIADVIGRFPYDANLEESRVRVIAPPFNFAQSLFYLFSGRKKRNLMTQCLWATRLRSKLIVRIMLSADPCRKLFYFAQQGLSVLQPKWRLYLLKLKLSAWLKRH